MRRNKEFDNTKIRFTLTKAGCRESEPVTLTGREFDELGKKKRKVGPLTKPQAECAALFTEFVRRGMGLK